MMMQVADASSDKQSLLDVVPLGNVLVDHLKRESTVQLCEADGGTESLGPRCKGAVTSKTMSVGVEGEIGDTSIYTIVGAAFAAALA